MYINRRDLEKFLETDNPSKEELLYMLTSNHKEGYLEIKVINIIRKNNQVLFSQSANAPYIELPLVVDEEVTFNDALVIHMGDAFLKTTDLLEDPNNIMQTAMFSDLDSVIDGDKFYILNLLVVAEHLLVPENVKQGYSLIPVNEAVQVTKLVDSEKLSQLVSKSLFPVNSEV